jgi:basic membrane protein A and related proteins
MGVKSMRWLPWVGVSTALLVALVVATTGSAKPTKTSATTFKAAIVTDTAGLNDKSFNALANKGRLRAQTQLNIETRVYISTTAADYRPNLNAAAQDGHRAIIGNGFLLADDLSAAAIRNSGSIYGIVDFPWVALKDKPQNAVGLTFKSEQSGYLVGYLAALMAKKKGGKQVLSAVGGKKIPSVDNWIAGYRAGAKRANPRVKVLIGYSDDFTPATAPKCKEIALRHIAQGAQSVFQVAGGCGLGALNAAKEKKRWGIGVDADQAYLGKHILTSGTKKVDNAVFNFIRDVKNGTLKTGTDIVFTLKNGGQGIGKISPKVPKSFITRMNKIKTLIIAGKIKPPAKL